MDQVEAYLSNVTSRPIGNDDNQQEDHHEDHIALEVDSRNSYSHRNSLESLEDIPQDIDHTDGSSLQNDDGFIEWIPENKMILNNPSTLLSRPLPNLMGNGSRFTRSISGVSTDQEASKLNLMYSHRKNAGSKGSFTSSTSISPPVSPMYIPGYASSPVSSAIYMNTYNRQSSNSYTLSRNTPVNDNEELIREQTSGRGPQDVRNSPTKDSSKKILKGDIIEKEVPPFKEDRKTESEFTTTNSILNYDNNSDNGTSTGISTNRNNLITTRTPTVHNHVVELVPTRQSYPQPYHQSIDSTATISSGGSHTLPSNASSPASISSELHDNSISYYYHGRGGNMYQRVVTNTPYYNSLSLFGRSRFFSNVNEWQRHCLLRWRRISRHPAFRLTLAIVFFLILYYQFLWSIARISGVYDQKASEIFAMALYSIIG